MRSRNTVNKCCKASVIVMVVVLLMLVVSAARPAKALRMSDTMAAIYGEVTWKDMYDNVRPLSWARITVDDRVNPPISTSSLDGWYSMIVPAGTYVITVDSTPDFAPANASDVVLAAGSSTMVNFDLTLAPQQIPEMPTFAQPMILMGALFILIVATRRLNFRQMSLRPA